MTADELASLSEKAARVLSGGGGLKALAQLLADTTQGAVLIEDDQWRHLALAEPRGGIGPLPASFSPFFRDAGAVRAGNGIVKAEISEALLALCTQMPGQSEGDGTPGYVTLFLRGKPGREVGPALRIAASAAAIECLRRGSSRGQARRAFWERYLGGDIADAADLKKEALAAGVILPLSFVPAVFDAEDETMAAARDTIVQSLASSEALCPLAGSSGHVIALFPVRHQIDVTRARQTAVHVVRELSEGKTGTVSCGIGAYRAELLELPIGLGEAREALALGRRLFGRGAVAVYPDLGIYALLHSGADREAFVGFASRLLDPLAAYDRKHKSDLLKTLQLYFEVGENVKEAAERLSVHRHTIFYRLNQISQILKADLKSSKDQLSLRAALAIRLMSPNEEPHE